MHAVDAHALLSMRCTHLGGKHSSAPRRILLGARTRCAPELCSPRKCTHAGDACALLDRGCTHLKGVVGSENF